MQGLVDDGCGGRVILRAASLLRGRSVQPFCTPEPDHASQLLCTSHPRQACGHYGHQRRASDLWRDGGRQQPCRATVQVVGAEGRRCGGGLSAQYPGLFLGGVGGATFRPVFCRPVVAPDAGRGRIHRPRQRREGGCGRCQSGKYRQSGFKTFGPVLVHHWRCRRGLQVVGRGDRVHAC